MYANCLYFVFKALFTFCEPRIKIKQDVSDDSEALTSDRIVCNFKLSFVIILKL